LNIKGSPAFLLHPVEKKIFLASFPVLMKPLVSKFSAYSFLMLLYTTGLGVEKEEPTGHICGIPTTKNDDIRIDIYHLFMCIYMFCE
jgi:hypothetical protein